MAPSADQINKCAQQWGSIDQTAFMVQLYHNMFSAHPEFQAFFKKLSFPINDSDSSFQKQVDVTKVMFDKAVTMAKNGDSSLLSTLHALAKRHVGYGVTQKEFQALKPILAKTAEDKVSGCDKKAWGEVCSYVLDNIVPE